MAGLTTIVLIIFMVFVVVMAVGLPWIGYKQEYGEDEQTDQE